MNQFGALPRQANKKQWIHPPHACGRHHQPVPPPEERHPMWDAKIASRSGDEEPKVGSRHPCRWAKPFECVGGALWQCIELRLVLCVDRRGAKEGRRGQCHMLRRVQHLSAGRLALTFQVASILFIALQVA